MDISSFDDLLHMASSQAQPQRLLFVFTRAELPPDSTAQERANFESGAGGALIPLVCVDRTPDELDTFARLVEESRQFALDWTIVFVAALSGQGGRMPTSEEAEAPLNRMVAAIEAGVPGRFIPFDMRGRPISFEPV